MQSMRNSIPPNLSHGLFPLHWRGLAFPKCNLLPNANLWRDWLLVNCSQGRQTLGARTYNVTILGTCNFWPRTVLRLVTICNSYRISQSLARFATRKL